MSEPTGILLLAYGTPGTPDDVEPYFTHIRGGRKPSPEAVRHLVDRYALVGGGTPLLDITLRAASALEAHLAHGPGEYRVFVAMKHWHPFIADVMPRIAALGVRRLIAIVLAPHYSRMSVGAYRHALLDANALLEQPLAISFVESWGVHPAFVTMLADRVHDGLAGFAEGDEGPIETLFSAHSLPVRIREWNDPYERQLQESCAAVARQAGLSHWRFAWQSAGGTGEPWLGPDIVEYLDQLRAEGVRRVLSVPIGFLSDHLEVLYDIDLEARQRAAELGITLHRIVMPNDSPALVATLAALVTDVERGMLGAAAGVAQGAGS